MSVSLSGDTTKGVGVGGMGVAVGGGIGVAVGGGETVAIGLIATREGSDSVPQAASAVSAATAANVNFAPQIPIRMMPLSPLAPHYSASDTESGAKVGRRASLARLCRLGAPGAGFRGRSRLVGCRICATI